MAKKAEKATGEVLDESVETKSKKKLVAKDVDPSQYVTVRNGFQGKLIYISPRTGERFEWESFGAEQEIELRELKNAKNSKKKFFMNNWFMFDEDWVVDYLGVRQYYKHAINIDSFDDIFKLPPERLRERLSGLSNGQKRSVIYRAKDLINQEKIDSLSTIKALEETLGCELVEK